MNTVILIGNVGKDPETRTTNNGKQVATFSLATSERWKDKNTGEKKETTDWHNVVVFNEGLVKVIESYVAKGKKLMVRGKLKTRKWQDKEGKDRWSTEVVLGQFDGEIELLGDKGDGAGQGRSEEGYGQTRDRGADRAGRDDVDKGFGGGGGDFNSDLDSEIPFSTMYSIR